MRSDKPNGPGLQHLFSGTAMWTKVLFYVPGFHPDRLASLVPGIFDTTINGRFLPQLINS